MSPTLSPRMLARQCYQAALAASAPASHVRQAMAACPPTTAPIYLIALGKAAEAMTAGAVAWAREEGRSFDGGLMISPHRPAALPTGMTWLPGDHPTPDEASLQAADALERFIAALPRESVVHLLISGGTSALIGAPLAGLSATIMRETFALLLTSGLAIHEMNAVRKRLTRWSAGRLAHALASRPVHAWLLSDVPGDDPATIASGPVSPDAWSGVEVEALLRRAALWDRLDPTVRTLIEVETLKAGDPVFAHVTTTVVASNATALAGITAEAARAGVPQRAFETLLAGDAREAGRLLATEAIRIAGEWASQNRMLIEDGHPEWVRPLVLYSGGETSVTIHGAAGTGGRSQEVALAAAEMLEVSPWLVTFLAAGTDGVDGPTDAAGALVDTTTWAAIRDAGISPEEALASHDSYPALRAADALIITGPTGGNVMDLVIAVVG